MIYRIRKRGNMKIEKIEKKETCIVCDGLGETVASKSYDGDLFSLEGEIVQCENCEGKGVIE